MNSIIDQAQDLLLQEQELESRFWVHNDVQFPKPLSPLFASFLLPAMEKGMESAFAKWSMNTKKIRTRLWNGYYYQSVESHKTNLSSRQVEHFNKVRADIPNLGAAFDRHVIDILLPFYEKLDQWAEEKLTVELAAERIQELELFFFTAWRIHYEVLIPKQSAGWLLEDTFAAAGLKGDPVSVYSLLLGTMNKSLETDRALWALARSITEHPELSFLFQTSAAHQLKERLENIEAGCTLLEEINSFLRVFGYRSTDSHEFLVKTWKEDIDFVLALIQSLHQSEYDFNSHFKTVVEKRERLLQETLDRIEDHHLRDEFIQAWEQAINVWRIEEDHHFYIDAMLPARARIFLLNVGNVLVELNVLQENEDIFYLYLNEVKSLLQQPQEVMERIKGRKRDFEAWCQMPPIPFLGVIDEIKPDRELERIFGFPQEPISMEMKTFKGYGASQGIYKGNVCVVDAQSDFSKINSGDVLVCRSTAPAWTILFSKIGALVTDSGGILSHAGIMAREYELPAVLGTKVATSVLKDGDTVIVDGNKGIVYFGLS
ncbi:PEP-utilizing enzyme [Paenibacillus thiaminolyticus]|uniref:PEP-utilizing enzyme n=1 Tax=Paenibacillus thiaminolyticus TaxID=49283 RepID=UPI0025438033|nr:PEP-utilizing enzyme [Paenibacillus thiaminolyticus]